MTENKLDLTSNGGLYFSLVAMSGYKVKSLIADNAQDINTLDDPTLQSYLNVVTDEALKKDPSINSDLFQHDIILQVTG